MTETEYENNITSLNASHEEYANHIKESKKKIASALTEKGVETSNEETLETMANNIKSIKGSGYSKSQTLTGSIAVPGASAYAPFSITFNELSKIDGYLNDMTFNGTNRAVINSMSVNGNQLNFTCTNGNSTSTYKLNYTITAFEF